MMPRLSKALNRFVFFILVSGFLTLAIPSHADDGFPYKDVQSMFILKGEGGVAFARFQAFEVMRDIIAASMAQASVERMRLVDISAYVFEARLYAPYDKQTVFIGTDWIGDGKVAGFLDEKGFEVFARLMSMRDEQPIRIISGMDRALVERLAEREREHELREIYEASVELHRRQQENQHHSFVESGQPGSLDDQVDTIDRMLEAATSMDEPVSQHSADSRSMVGSSMFAGNEGSLQAAVEEPQSEVDSQEQTGFVKLFSVVLIVLVMLAIGVFIRSRR